MCRLYTCSICAYVCYSSKKLKQKFQCSRCYFFHPFYSWEDWGSKLADGHIADGHIAGIGSQTVWCWTTGSYSRLTLPLCVWCKGDSARSQSTGQKGTQEQRSARPLGAAPRKRCQVLEPHTGAFDLPILLAPFSKLLFGKVRQKTNALNDLESV